MAAGGDTASLPIETPAAATTTAAAHIPMADRLSLVSWGDDSEPSIPSADDSSSDGAGTESIMTESVLKSTTTSVRKSIYEFAEENGRTYHRYKEGKYPLPNDLQEQARLDLQHAIFLLTVHGKLFLAPIDNPRRVLDIGTGTGIWAIELALQFPDARIIGTDLSPIQPDFVPANCRFEVDDAEDEWSFGEPFDYIHGRALLSCFRDPASVIRSAYNALGPGGFLELQDAHFPICFASPPPPNCALARWIDLVKEGAARTGRPWTNSTKYKQWMEEAGFENVVQRKFFWPCNTWAKGAYYKSIGAYVLEDLLNGLEGLSLKLLAVMGMEYGDIQELIAQVRRDLTNTKIHSYVNISFFWGQRPAAGAVEAAASEGC